MATVACSRCGRQAEALAKPPLLGKRGQEVLDTVCASCWKEWEQESFRTINHLGLQPVDPADRQRLWVIMREYLKLPVVQI